MASEVFGFLGIYSMDRKRSDYKTGQAKKNLITISFSRCYLATERSLAAASARRLPEMVSTGNSVYTLTTANNKSANAKRGSTL